MNSSHAQRRDISPPEAVEFRLLLHCTPTKTKTEKVLTLQQLPESVRDLKQCIQSSLNIPVCCQTLYFESVALRDCETLRFYRIQDNDTLRVHYTSEADVADIVEILASIRSSIVFLVSLRDELVYGPQAPDLDLRVARSVKFALVESLAYRYFYPSVSERAEANRKFLIANNGLQLMHEAHVLLLELPWSKMPLELQYLEHAILRTLWNITASFSVREEVLHRPTLQAISKSFLRARVKRDQMITAPRCPEIQQSAVMNAERDRILSEVIYKAVGTLCNLAEMPKCRLTIASDPLVLTQMVGLMLTPTYKYIASLVTTAGLLCLAYSSETHQYLAAPEVVDGVMDACEKKRTWYRCTVEELRLDQLLLRYFATMFFAQLVNCSQHHLSHASQARISVFMDDFLQTADYKEVRKHEVQNGYIWSTLVPFIKLVYLPHGAGTELTKLQELCIEAGVFSLQNMLSGDEGKAVLVKEGLVEYITCMPWCIPHSLVARGRACDLVADLRQKLQLQPPSLNVLARAKLAVMKFGLERMLGVVSAQKLLIDMQQECVN